MQQAKPKDSRKRFFQSSFVWANLVGIFVVAVDFISNPEFLELIGWPQELETLLGWLPDNVRGFVIALLIMGAFIYNLYNKRQTVQWLNLPSQTQNKGG